MKTSKKKPSLFFLLLGAVLAAYLGYLMNGAWEEGMTLSAFLPAFNKVLQCHLLIIMSHLL